MAEDLEAALKCMLEGGIILYPTDTVWGIGCDATNPEAVKKVFSLKKRDDEKSLIVLVDSEIGLERIVDEVPEIALQILEVADRPMTLILDGARNLAPNVVSADGSIGVRITHEAFSHELCKRLRRPVVSTSANVSGQKAPAVFKEISDEIKNGVDYVVNYRRDDEHRSQPSNIIKVGKGGIVTVIR